MLHAPMLQASAPRPASNSKPAAGGDGGLPGIAPAEPGAEGKDIPPKLLEQAAERLQQGEPMKEVLSDLSADLEALTGEPVAPGALVELAVRLTELRDSVPKVSTGFLAGQGAAEAGESEVLPDLQATSPDGKVAEELAEATKPQVSPGLLATPANGPAGPGSRPQASPGLQAMPHSGSADAVDEAFSDGLLLKSAAHQDKQALSQRVPVVEQLPQSSPGLQAAPLPPLRPLTLPASMVAAASPTGMDASQATLIPPRVGDPGWGQAMAQRVMWMIGKDRQVAELRLTPAHLGPLEVRVSMQQDQASVTLLAANSMVREALEQSLPRLRDMLGQQDIQLVQADIGQRQDSRHRRPGADGSGQGADGGQGPARGSEAGDQGDEQLAAAGAVTQGVGLVDAYA